MVLLVFILFFLIDIRTYDVQYSRISFLRLSPTYTNDVYNSNRGLVKSLIYNIEYFVTA